MLQGCSSTKLLQSRLLHTVEDVAVVAEEEVVALVVEGAHTPALEVGLQRGMILKRCYRDFRRM